MSDRSFRSRIGVPSICGKTVPAECIVQDAHNKLGHGPNVLQILSIIQAEFYILGVRKLILRLKKSCPDCIKLNKVSFSAVEGDMPDILKSIQPPFSYCQIDLFVQSSATTATTLPSTGSWLFSAYQVVQYIWRYWTATLFRAFLEDSGEHLLCEESYM